MKLLIFITLLIANLASAAPLKVAVLSELLGDLTQQIGGDKVSVINLAEGMSNPHDFSPTPRDISKAQGARLYIASGKGLESYLPKLKSIVGSQAEVIELGRSVVSIKISGDSAVYACCPKHSFGAIDPHWWHSIEAWRRASTALAKELGKADPTNAAYYKARAKNYRNELSKLKSWCKKELAGIPRQQRLLTTAHAAFTYFCKEFKFQAIPIQGLNKQQSASPQYIAEAISIIKKRKVEAIFPEKGANSKGIQSIANSTGTKIAPALYGDTAPTIKELFRHNVSVIKQALQ
ncbi:metal ABC transporter substrate-binding protein [Rubritalea marina]|uniref:metal ABC transporter substrate-binding protein n=1 Tax=Rubritalea marina TaxID=361055 RepID=UPI0003805558|nr:metal ABC transporter substrate-binding protein [Rubritalea marina]